MPAMRMENEPHAVHYQMVERRAGNQLRCHQDAVQNMCIMQQPGSLNVPHLIQRRPVVFQDQPGQPLPARQCMFTTKEGAVAMDALACGYGDTGDIQHGSVGQG